MAKKQAHATPQEVWDLLREFQKENTKGFKELRESQAETAQGFKEIRESQKETDRQMKETDRQMKETDRKVKEVSKNLGNLGNKWGDFMESLVEGDLVGLLKERKIQIERLAGIRTFTWQGKEYEFDLIAINGSEVVVVEVKSSLNLKDVEHFINKLKDFKTVCPEYTSKKIYGAVAYLKANEGSDRYSEKKGLFVIKAPSGDSQFSSITNSKGFQPRDFE